MPHPTDSGADRASKHQAAILWLAALTKVGFAEKLRQILRVDADTIEVDRVSYWRFEQEPQRIRCEALYVRSQDSYDAGLELAATDYPAYFAAMREGGLIVAEDAHTHPSTAEFSPAYLGPAGIGAMLDVPVYVGGELCGVVCHEHVGAQRRWTYDEQQFALSIGQMFSTATETEQRLKAEHALRESEARLRMVVELMPIAVVVSSMDGHCLFANHTAARSLGVGTPQLMAARMVDFYRNPADREELLRRVRAEGTVRDLEIELRRPDGSCFWANASVQPIEFAGQRALITGLLDVTDRRQREEAHRHMALHDPLTDLPNRAMLEDLLRKEIARCDRNPAYRFSLLYLDLDGFKQINDTHGHHAGDLLLQSVAERLRVSLRSTDAAARIGGDEFAVLLTATPMAETAIIAARLEKALVEPHELFGLDLVVPSSIGAVHSQRSLFSPEGFLEAADQAMYQAKRRKSAELGASENSERATESFPRRG